MGAINRKTTGNPGSLFVSRTGFITWVNIKNIWGEDLLENGNKNRWNLPCGELLLSLLCTRSFRKNSLLHPFYIACSIRADILLIALIFPRPCGARKIQRNSQNIHTYYMLNHRISWIYSTTKNSYFAIGFYFLVRVFRNILIPSVRMTLTMSKMFARIICQTIEWEVNYFTAKEKWYFGFYFLMRVSKTSWFCQPQLLLLHPPVFALL